jgi:4'-phosphopantetheinyl transferase
MARPNTSSEVHLWKYELKELPVKFPFQNILSQDELIKTKRFINREDGKRFAAVHVFLREVLSRYLYLPASEIRIAVGRNKKPVLKTSAVKPLLHFNLSYRNKYALLAISSKPSIGVDIEEVNNIPDFAAFISNYFSKEEQQTILEKETREEQLSVLFTLWAMKVALLKSLTIGVKGSFATYNLCPFLQQPRGALALGKHRAWNISPVSIAENYRAAFAIPANHVDLKMFEYGKD